MDDFAKQIGYTVIFGSYLALMFGGLAAFFVMLGWCWRAGNWIIFGTDVEAFPFAWFMLGAGALALKIHEWRYDVRHPEISD